MNTDKSKEELFKEISDLNKKIQQLETDLSNIREKADISNLIKSMFLANISHEIRTPMNGIIGMYNVLKLTELTDEQREYLDIINLSGNNLLTIIDDILDLAKIEAGQLTLDHENFSLKNELNHVINLLKDKAKGKGIELFLKIQPEIPDSLIGDQTRLKLIIVNLAYNAIKYTKEGSVTIKIEVLNRKNNTIELKFNITDTGIGISHEDKEKLFKAFSQIDSSTTRKYGGTGLGLAISKHLSSLMNGNIGVDSVVGKGSTFWFTAHLEVDSKIDTPSK
jgi:signal transduction histidine kinase